MSSSLALVLSAYIIRRNILYSIYLHGIYTYTKLLAYSILFLRQADGVSYNAAISACEKD